MNMRSVYALFLFVLGVLNNTSCCEYFENTIDVFTKIHYSDSLEIIDEMNMLSFNDGNTNNTGAEIFKESLISNSESLQLKMRNNKYDYEFRRKYYHSDLLKIKKTDTLFRYIKDTWISDKWEAYWNSKTGACICNDFAKDSTGLYHELGYRVYPLSHMISNDLRNLISNWEHFKAHAKSHQLKDNIYDCEMTAFDNEYPTIKRIIFQDGEIIKNEQISICDCLFDEIENGNP